MAEVERQHFGGNSGGLGVDIGRTRQPTFPYCDAPSSELGFSTLIGPLPGDSEKSDLGIVDGVFNAARRIDPNKALAVAGVVTAVAMVKSKLFLPLRAVGVVSAGVVALGGISEIRNASITAKSGKQADVARTVEILERS